MVSKGKTSEALGWFTTPGTCPTLATVVLPLRLVLAGGQESGGQLVYASKETDQRQFSGHGARGGASAVVAVTCHTDQRPHTSMLQ